MNKQQNKKWISNKIKKCNKKEKLLHDTRVWDQNWLLPQNQFYFYQTQKWAMSFNMYIIYMF